MKHLMRAAPILAALTVIFAPTAVTAQPAPSQSGEINAGIRKEVLTELANKLESQYVIESTAKQLAALVRSKQKSNTYKNLKTGPDLARALTEDLATVAHDKHLRVYYSFKPISEDAPGGSKKDFLEEMRKVNGLVPKVEILNGNVGYIRVDGVPPPDISERVVAAAFAFVHETDALIIDNRGNGGGDPNTVALYVSYLSEGPPKVINSFHWRANHQVVEFKTTDLGDLSYGSRKPVYVLASHMTFSGGEELTYDLQVSKRAVIVGEVTGGGANPGGPESLGHQFGVFMPQGQPVNPITGTNWEGKGIQPDVPVPAAMALSKAQALAIERLAADEGHAP
ncbi:MAG: S41 family peptidase [Proteobacteria bacterium]|nr:S41 family peptidase [Pseudomonadota bacterium]